MKIVIVGAGGGVGSVMANWLSRQPEYDEIVLAGRKRNTLNKAKNDMKYKERAKIAVVDAGNVNDMKKVFRGADMVVNSTLPRYFLKIMKACLETGTNYVDMATDLAVMNEPPGQVVKRVPLDLQLDQDKQWKKKDISAMICWGMDPGAVNVFTRHAADGMDKVDEIKIRDGDKSSVKGFDKFYAPWSPDTLIEEVAYMNSLIWTKGHWERKEPVTVQEEWEFPQPVGKLKVTLVDHEETQSLPRFIGKGCKEMSFMIALGDDWLNVVKALRMVGLVDCKPVNARGVKVVPRDVIVACMASPVDPNIQCNTIGNSSVGAAVYGSKGGKKFMHYMWNTMSHQYCWKEYRATATPTQVAIPTAIAVTLYAQGKIKERGVYPPEVLDANMILRNFRKYGFEVGQMKKKID